MSDYDVAIVGAGFVGASLAIALKRTGFKVLVIDSRTPLVEVGSEDVRGLALSPSSQSVFSDLGLWSTLSARAMPIREIAVSEQGALPSVQLSASEFDLDALAHVVPADFLLRTIENQLLSEVKVCWRASLDSYHLSGDEVVLNLDTKDSSCQQFTAKLLIGADGINSKVRELAGISSTIRAYNQQAIVATVAIDGLPTDLAIERFTASGPVAILPSSPTRHVVVRCCRLEESDSLMQLGEDEFLSDVRARLGRPLGKFRELGQRRAHPLVLAQAENLIAERVALLGAAAVTVHPNAAQGLNLGMRDVAEFCHHFANAGLAALGSHHQLTTLAKNRSKDHQRVVRFTDGLARGFTTRFPGLRFARALGLAATKLSGSLRREIIYQGIGQGRVPRLQFAGQELEVETRA